MFCCGELWRWTVRENLQPQAVLLIASIPGKTTKEDSNRCCVCTYAIHCPSFTLMQPRLTLHICCNLVNSIKSIFYNVWYCKSHTIKTSLDSLDRWKTALRQELPYCSCTKGGHWNPVSWSNPSVPTLLDGLGRIS